MFGAEPQEPWTKEEAAEFEVHVSAQLRKTVRAALIADGFFILWCVGISFFLAGHSLHRYWESVGKYLLLAAFPLMLFALYRTLDIYNSWQAARETRQEMGEPR